VQTAFDAVCQQVTPDPPGAVGPEADDQATRRHVTRQLHREYRFVMRRGYEKTRIALTKQIHSQ
jgi:hypothetical protein